MPPSGTKKPITPTINSSRQMKPAFLLGAFIVIFLLFSRPPYNRRGLKSKEAADSTPPPRPMNPRLGRFVLDVPGCPFAGQRPPGFLLDL